MHLLYFWSICRTNFICFHFCTFNNTKHYCLCRDNVRVTGKTLRPIPALCYADDSAAVPKMTSRGQQSPPNQFYEEKLVFMEYTQGFLVFLTDDVFIRQVLEIVSGQKHCFTCRHVTATPEHHSFCGSGWTDGFIWSELQVGGKVCSFFMLPWNVRN